MFYNRQGLYVPLLGQEGVLEQVLAHLPEPLTVGGPRTLIDVGCNDGLYIKKLRNWRTDLFIHGVDAYFPALRESGADVLWHGKLPGILGHCATLNYDVAICLDVIEHLSKEDGLRLKHFLQAIATVSIVFTPLGFQEQDGEAFNDPEQRDLMRHRSGWTEADFADADWQTEVWPNFNYGNGKVGNALWAIRGTKLR